VTTKGQPTDWVIADVWETVAATRPAAECVVQGRDRLTWSGFDAAADAVAADMLARGLTHQAKVALFLRNAPAFLAGVFACLKAGLVPVNTNFRYTADEVTRLWEDADAECVVFAGSLAAVAARARPGLPRVRAWYWVDDGDGPCPDWAVPFGQLRPGQRQVRAPWGRSPDDLLLLYTGGTTGSPKGVMWRQDDVFATLNATAAVRYPAADGLAGVAGAQRGDGRPRPRFVPCGPLVHGTGGFSAYGVLGAGGTVVLLEGRSFSAEELLDVIDREQVSHVSVVGEAHVRPVVDLLDAQPKRWCLSSLRLVTSAGMALSQESRQRLLRHCPDVLCVDILGSSESPLLGRSRSTASSPARSATFSLGPGVRVLDEDDRDVVPGSGQIGVLVAKGRGPLGYYKDPERSARTFRVIDGERWSVSGDMATVRADGTIEMLGRGSAVINTGGEKVYTREIEDVLLRDPAVADAAVVGIPHPVLGSMVVAAVQPRPDCHVDPERLARKLRESLSGYKVPRQLHVVDSVGRSESGKIDYPALVDRMKLLDASS
jgi:acyl-CoA synthetase (AMP-forming)/AMP-acid ligase II